jgi:glutamate synthase domain-containing protein 3
VSSPLQINLTTTPADAVNSQILSLGASPEAEVSVVGCSGQNFIANGIRLHGRITFAGSVGDFSLMSFGNAEANIDGNVGDFFAHSIQGGAIFVRGDAGSSLGALGAGGLVSIKGNALDRAAVALQGADLVVRGNVRDLAGLGLQSGTLIICGNAGKEMGKGLRGGTIYLRGDVESVSPEIEEVRLREPDKLKIGMIMLKSGLNVTGKEFRVYRSAS